MLEPIIVSKDYYTYGFFIMFGRWPTKQLRASYKLALYKKHFRLAK